MKVMKKTHGFQVVNYDQVVLDFTHTKRQGPDLPQNIRCIVAGGSSSGKTNLVLSLILSAHGLSFENLYVFSKTLNQPKYEFLRKVMKGVPEIRFKEFSDGSQMGEIPHNTLILADDIAMDSQFEKFSKIVFSRGRHFGLNVFLLVQSYAQTQKHMVRDNTNLVIVFRTDTLNLKLLHRDSASELPFNVFERISNRAWEKEFNFLCIDKTLGTNNGKYRINFTDYFTDL